MAVDSGTVVYSPSAKEVMVGRILRLAVGAVLIVVGAIAVVSSLAGGASSDDATGGAALTLMATTIVGVAILGFGLKYLLFGLRYRGVVLHEQTVTADFPGRYYIWPERRTEPLLRVRVGGTARMTNAFAITTRGYSFRLPDRLVEKADLWDLGSLGVDPVAPGGRAAKAAYEEGRLEAPSRNVAAIEADLVLDLGVEAAPEEKAEAPAAPTPRRAPRLARPIIEPPAPSASSRAERVSPPPTPPSIPTPPPPPPPEAPTLEAPSAPEAEEGGWDLEEITPPEELVETPPPPMEPEAAEPEPPPPEPAAPEEKPKKPAPEGWDWEEVEVPPS
jgi:hypothetical protein